MYVREYADVVVGLQYGDEGKGKITAALSATRNYSLTARYSGGANAGHTVYVDDKVVKLHQLPSSLPYKELGYIGPGALIDFNNANKDIIATTKDEIVIKQYWQGVTIFKDGNAKVLTEDDGLTDPRTSDIASDSKGNIWIASDGGGVFKYDGDEIVAKLK